MTAIAEFVDETVDKLVDKFEAHSTRIRNAILDACESRFVALEMALKTAQSGAKGFQFAREKDAGEIVDLPNPLRPPRLDS